MINLNKWKIIAGLFSAYFIYQFSINWSFTENSFYIFLIVSILIAALSYLFTFIFKVILDILNIGWSKTISYKNYTIKKKSFFWFCVLSFVFFVLAGLIYLSDLQVKSRVPFYLSSYVYVNDSADKYNKNFAHAAGSWRIEGEHESFYAPYQTSEIKCYKDIGMCFEARASVWRNSLESKLHIYKVINWSNGIINFQKDDMCYQENFTINQNTKSVNGLGKYKKIKECNTNEKTQEIKYQLISGWDVYWELMKKERPFLLRIIGSIFN